MEPEWVCVTKGLQRKWWSIFWGPVINDTVASILVVCNSACAPSLSLFFLHPPSPPQVIYLLWEKPAAVLYNPGERATWHETEVSRQQPREWACRQVLLPSQSFRRQQPSQQLTAPSSETLSSKNFQTSCSLNPDPPRLYEIIHVGCFKLLSFRVCNHR